jgi:hypothetical protein
MHALSFLPLCTAIALVSVGGSSKWQPLSSARNTLSFARPNSSHPTKWEAYLVLSHTLCLFFLTTGGIVFL